MERAQLKNFMKSTLGRKKSKKRKQDGQRTEILPLKVWRKGINKHKGKIGI